MNKKREIRFPPRIIMILIFIGIIFGIYSFIEPSNDRDWSEDQKTISYANISESQIEIFNIRNFSYFNTSVYNQSYYNNTFDLDNLTGVWFVVEPFSGFMGAAHTFLSFEFNNDSYIAISVEIRKEKGESFSAVKGLLRRYEIMYVIGTEEDLIKLRANHRNDTVYLYRTNTTKEKSQKLFLSMLNRANELALQPEFYNTLTNTCTTNIVKHVNSISFKRVPFSIKVLFPANSDKLAYDIGLIETNMTFEQTREFYRINNAADKYENSSEFSKKIRQHG
jgi:hypothetical protein